MMPRADLLNPATYSMVDLMRMEYSVHQTGVKHGKAFMLVLMNELKKRSLNLYQAGTVQLMNPEMYLR